MIATVASQFAFDANVITHLAPFLFTAGFVVNS
jgi:hypothetical protein